MTEKDIDIFVLSFFLLESIFILFIYNLFISNGTLFGKSYCFLFS